MEILFLEATNRKILFKTSGKSIFKLYLHLDIDKLTISLLILNIIQNITSEKENLELLIKGNDFFEKLLLLEQSTSETLHNKITSIYRTWINTSKYNYFYLMNFSILFKILLCDDNFVVSSILNVNFYFYPRYYYLSYKNQYYHHWIGLCIIQNHNGFFYLITING